MAAERTETTIVEVPPERKQAAVKRQQEFGWTLVSAQEETKLSGGETRKRVKLLFTRTATAEWVEDMKHLEKELQTLDTSVEIGSDKLVVLPNRPILNLPVPILIVIAFGGYLAGWFVAGLAGGIIGAFVLTAGSWLFYRQRGRKKLLVHTAARKKATEAFIDSRRELLVRLRAHVNTRAPSA